MINDSMIDMVSSGMNQMNAKKVNFSKLAENRDAIELGDLVYVDVFRAAYLVENDESLPVGVNVRVENIGTYTDKDVVMEALLFGKVEGGMYDGRGAYVEFKRPVNEITTSDGLAFAPGVVGTPSPSQKAAEDVADDDVDPIELANRKKKMQLMKEDVDRRIVQRKDEIVQAIDDIVSARKIGDASFIAEFPITQDVSPQTVVLTPFNVKTGARDLKDKLPDMIGQLDLILSAIETGGEIGQFDVFEGKTALYGGRMVAEYKGVTLTYEGFVERKDVETETVSISSKDVVDAVSEKFSGLKIVETVIFPVGGLFAKGFMGKLKSVIEDVTSKKETPNA